MRNTSCGTPLKSVLEVLLWVLPAPGEYPLPALADPSLRSG